MRIPRVKDFVGIGRADGRNSVGTLNRTLHEVDAAVIFKQRGLVGRNSENILKKLLAVNALILNVMNRENRLYVFITR